MHIEVMLMDDVKKLGKSGQIVKVAPGYARNYLFPKGLASIATEAVARKLEKLEITVSAPTTDGKKLYGAVSVSDILAAIEANRGIKIERRQLELNDALREVGVYEPSIDLGRGVTVKFKITILDETAPEA